MILLSLFSRSPSKSPSGPNLGGLFLAQSPLPVAAEIRKGRRPNKNQPSIWGSREEIQRAGKGGERSLRGQKGWGGRGRRAKATARGTGEGWVGGGTGRVKGRMGEVLGRCQK